MHALIIKYSFVYFPVNNQAINRSPDTSPENQSTSEISNNGSSCIQKESETFLTGDSLSRAIQIGLLITMMAIFVAGIVCRLTVQLPEMNATLFANNNSLIHSS